MNKKPYILRTLFALLVILVFVASMFPLTQSNFFTTLESLLEDPSNPVVQKVITDAKALREQDKNMYDSTALEEAAKANNVNLSKYVKPVISKSQKLLTNGDVISLVRKNAAGSIRLGIDLDGGVEFMLRLEPQDEEMAKMDRTTFEHYRDVTIETMRKRLESKSIFESEISPAGQSFISLRAPLSTKEEKANLEKLIAMTAKLQFKLVHPNSAKEVEKYLANPETYEAPEGTVIMECSDMDKQGNLVKRHFLIEREQMMDGRGIKSASVGMSDYGSREIHFSFKNAEGQEFGELTRANIGRGLAIILDGKLYSAPTVQSAIFGSGQITGAFSKEEAENIANALVSGSVPFKITIAQRSDIDPTVGQETVHDSLVSGILGTLLVMVFMLIYYRISGIVANISLVVNSLLILGALAAFNVTLTLPGIAGIILTIGMAVDANILIYERIREELEKGKNIASAVEIGFGRAFTAIFDSNVTTLFVALILMWQGSGAIKGFAITLAIGIFTTLFTAVFLTHLVFDIFLRYFNVTRLKMMCFLKSPHINFLGQRKIAIALSIIMVVVSLGYLGYQGKEVLGIDFTGGTQLEFDYQQSVPMGDVDSFLRKLGFEAKTAYKSTTAVDKKVLEMVIRPQKSSHTAIAYDDNAILETMTQKLNEAFPQAKFKGIRQDTLGALIGDVFMRSALISVACAMLGMLIYMMIRFELSYSVAANVAIIHDVIIALGIFTICGGQITLQTIAGVLTLIGYSVNDTIVTFDRQRENLHLLQGETYWNIINISINQTLGRTMLTSFSVILVLLMQMFFGGSGIRDFVSIMLIGCIVGTYSSIYTASIIVAYWHKQASNVKEDEVPGIEVQDENGHKIVRA